MNETLAPIDPKTTALLVMDYQPGIIGMLGDDGPALLARAKETIRIARAHGATIGYVRVAFDDPDYAKIPPHSRFSQLLETAGRAFHHDAPATAIHDDIEPESNDIVVRKTRVGAFSTTDLDAQLKARGITTLLLAGISTSGVVLSTVRDAADRDYRVVVIADACADRDADVHATLTQKVFPGQALVIDLADLDALLTPIG